MTHDDPASTETEVRQRRVGLHLAELAERLDPDSFTLFLRMVSGLNQAFAQRNQHVDIEMTPEERALCTPELQQELIRLVEKAGFPGEHIVSGLAVPSPDEDRAVARARHGRA